MPDQPRLDVDERVAAYTSSSFVTLPALLTRDEVAEMNEAIDRDRRDNPFMWTSGGAPDYNSLILLTQPVFERIIRHPFVLELTEVLMGGPICFEELSVRQNIPIPGGEPTGWHRDRGSINGLGGAADIYWRDHPLYLDFPQLIVYLTDVDETTDCFSVSPEPPGDPILDVDEQLRQRGAFHFHGAAGDGILFNSACLHGRTARDGSTPRRIVQVYYGHPDRPCLSEVSIIPRRLWHDHPDPEIRRFYGKLNRYTKVMYETMGLSPTVG